MAETISAEDGALRKGADAVASARAAIKARTREVNDSVNGSRSWDSPASREFLKLMESWDTKAEDLLKVLDRLEEALGGADKDQQANEESSQSTITGLGSAMSGI